MKITFFFFKKNELPDEKDYLDRVNYKDFFSLFIIFNRIKLFQKVSKTFMHHTLKYIFFKKKIS